MCFKHQRSVTVVTCTGLHTAQAWAAPHEAARASGGCWGFNTVPLSLNKTEICNSISNKRCLRTLVSISFIYYFNSKRKKHGPGPVQLYSALGPVQTEAQAPRTQSQNLQMAEQSREPAWPSRPGPGAGTVEADLGLESGRGPRC